MMEMFIKTFANENVNLIILNLSSKTCFDYVLKIFMTVSL